MTDRLTRHRLSSLLQASDLREISFPQLVRFFQDDRKVRHFKPDGLCQIDPRNGERVLFSSARARRPRDDFSQENREGLRGKEKGHSGRCAVCAGNTTGIVDVAGLSEGFTFINKNLYPILFPEGMNDSPIDPGRDALTPNGGGAFGFHFLQWSSSVHGHDWQTLGHEDRLVLMCRLAVLEEKLLKESRGYMPSATGWGGPAGHFGFFSIIKNHGHLVGGSLEHGHQQMGFSNVMPRRYRDNLSFLRRHGEPFSAFMLRENPKDLALRDYGPALLAVPYFMRRPFEMMLFLKDTKKSFLYEATPTELGALGKGWHDAILAMLEVLRGLGRAPAYNITFHLGPGAGIYCEFLPLTQEMGGYEQLGLYVCQSRPQKAARELQDIFTNRIGAGP